MRDSLFGGKLFPVIESGTKVGAFRVEHLLGKGGMASVYRAVQIRLDRPVALKILNPVLAADDQFFQRFQIEGINAARLEHPHIVPVYEAGEDAGFAFLAMKLVEGETFNAMITRERHVSPPDALRVLTDVARALDYAHGRGFIHRDVKPANVLIDEGGHVFLSDFGLSKDMGSRGLTGTGQWMGTAEYMAPEQALGKAIDYRADLYALGCMAFECLTGDPPFLADSPLAVMMAHASSEIPSATANVPLPSAVNDVMKRAIAKDPDDRYGAALAFVDSLQAACEERELTSMAEPKDGFKLYRGTLTPVRASSAPAAPARPPDVPSWPTSAPPQPPSAPPTPFAAPAPPSNLFCPRCMDTLEPADLFCGGCGNRMVWCGACRGPRLESDRFCPHCGATSGAGYQ